MFGRHERAGGRIVVGNRFHVVGSREKRRKALSIGACFQDDYKISTRLTVNLGVRWDADVNLQRGNVQGKSRTYLALKQVGSPWAGGLPKNDLKDFSPRLGSAYDLTGRGKHVLAGRLLHLLPIAGSSFAKQVNSRYTPS